jgi:hypothetical protein
MEETIALIVVTIAPLATADSARYWALQGRRYA